MNNETTPAALPVEALAPSDEQIDKLCQWQERTFKLFENVDKVAMRAWARNFLKQAAEIGALSPPAVPPGTKMLRRMPNSAMVEAGREAMSPEKFVSHCRTLWVWNAMWDAAPGVASADEDYGSTPPAVLVEPASHPLDAMLNEITQLIDGCKLDWEAQGCWSEWDQSVRDRITAYNLGRLAAAPSGVTKQPATDSYLKGSGG